MRLFSRNMRGCIYLSALGLLLLTAITGCTSWQTTPGLPGLSEWNEERAVLKKVKNDPFPTPQQVGLK